MEDFYNSEAFQEFFKDYSELRRKYSKHLSQINTTINCSDLSFQYILNLLIFIKFLEQINRFGSNSNYLEDIINYCEENNQDFLKKGLKPIIVALSCKDQGFNENKNGPKNKEFHDKKQPFDLEIEMVQNLESLKRFNLPLFNNFKEYKWNDTISLSIWKEINKFLAKYTYIPKEIVSRRDLPKNQDYTSIITPQIFGYLCELNAQIGITNKKGTVFTPPHISRDIIITSIDKYISDHLNLPLGTLNELLKNERREKGNNGKNDKSLDKGPNKSDEKLKYLEVKGESYKINQKHILKIIQLIQNLKIIDNSCGSGSFLLRILEIIFEIIKCKSIINNTSTETDFDIYYNILENNLYGVDINPIGVQSTRLRLWLNLFLIQQKDDLLKKLPLLKQIKTGNSLFGLIYGELSQNNKFNSNTYNSNTLNQFTKGNLINKSKNEKNSRLNQQNLSINYLKFYNISLSREEEKSFLKEQLFHWEKEFPDVFNKNRKKSGFDLVVGNPPYGNLLSKLQKQVAKQVFSTMKGKKGSNNIASLFIERTLDLLNEGGICGYIIPNTIARKDQFWKIRKKLIENAHLFKIIDAGNPFINSKVNLEMIILYFKKRFKPDTIELSKNEKTYFYSLKDESSNSIPTSIFHEKDWYILYYDKIFELIHKYNPRKLGEFCNFMGAKRPSALKVKMSKQGSIQVVKGGSIKRFILKNFRYIEENEKVIEYKNNLEYPLLILPEVSNTVKCSICYNDNLPISGVMIQKINTPTFSQVFYLLLLNCKVISFYFNNYIINRAHMTTHLDSTYLERLPVPTIQELNPLEYIGTIVGLLSAIDEESYKEIIRNFHAKIIDPLFYELFFPSLFRDKKFQKILFEKCKTLNIIEIIRTLNVFNNSNSNKNESRPKKTKHIINIKNQITLASFSERKSQDIEINFKNLPNSFNLKPDSLNILKNVLLNIMNTKSIKEYRKQILNHEVILHIDEKMNKYFYSK